MKLPTLEHSKSRNSHFSRIELKPEKRRQLQSLSTIELGKQKEEQMKSKNLTDLLVLNLSVDRRLQLDESDFREINESKTLQLGRWGYQLGVDFM